MLSRRGLIKFGAAVAAGGTADEALGQAPSTAVPSIQLQYNVDLGTDAICAFACDNGRAVFEPAFPREQGYVLLLDAAQKAIDLTRLKLIGTNSDVRHPVAVETGQPIIDQATGKTVDLMTLSVYCAKREFWVVKEKGNLAGNFNVITVYEQPVTLKLFAVLLLKPDLTKAQTDAIVLGFADYKPSAGDPTSYALKGMGVEITADMFCVRPHFTLEKEGAPIAHRRGPAPNESLGGFESHQEEGKPATLITVDHRKDNFGAYVEKRGFTVLKTRKEEQLCPPPPPAHDPVHEREVSQADLIANDPPQVNEIVTSEASSLGCEIDTPWKLKIAELLRWPEFMVAWVDIEVHIGCMQVVLRWPFLRTRSCELTLFAYAGYPKNILEHVFDAIKTCLYVAAISGAVIGVITFQPEAAIHAFVAVFNACIEEKKGEIGACLVPGLALLTFHSDWH